MEVSAPRHLEATQSLKSYLFLISGSCRMMFLGFMSGIMRGFERPRYVTLSACEISMIPLNRRRVVLYLARSHSRSPASELIGKRGLDDTLASCGAASSNI